MNAVTKHESAALPALQMNDSELIEVLSTSLYPGAAVNSIKMVIGYCRVTGLDPMQKPVHIVPMWDSKAKQMRDVVMPGIGLYRIQAARTNEHVGTDKPIFGPMVEYELNGVKVLVPEWCEVTVYRMKCGQKCAYTAQEFWIENYATAGRDTTAPNQMWKKRPRGQLAKCAEAQALRRGFSEVGNQPTAEEMEGKMLGDGVVIDAETGVITDGKQVQQGKPALPPYTDDKISAILPEWAKAIKDGKAKSVDQIVAFIKSKNTLTADQEKRIREGCAQPASANDAPAVTASEVMAKLDAAATSEDLDSAAGLIPAVPEAERAALNARYDELHTKFNAQE